MRCTGMLAGAAIAVALAGCEEVPLTPAPVTGSTPTAETAVTTDSAFMSGLNALRAQHGQPPAAPDSRLMTAAQLHAEDMAANGYFNHRSRDGRSYTQRIAAQGYPTCWPVENIAFGSHSPSGALAQWTGSPPHLRNMLTSGTVRFGLGQAGNIFVLDLARTC